MPENSPGNPNDTPIPTLRHVLAVTRRVASDGSVASSVPCPRRGNSIAVRDCGKCEHCLGMIVNVGGLGTLLKCAWGQETTASDEVGAARASQTRTLEPNLRELMTRGACVARAETTIEAVTDRMLRDGIEAIAVQDQDGTAIGMVSSSDLLRKYFEDGDTGEMVPESARALHAGASLHTVHAGQASVSEVIGRPAFGLPADASVAAAAALMAYEGVHQLMVFEDDGRVAGVLSSLDILGWFARREGFVLPRTRRGSHDTDCAMEQPLDPSASLQRS